MALLALGLFLIVVGAALAATAVGPLSFLFAWIGWVSLAMGAVFSVVHVAVGPRRIA